MVYLKKSTETLSRKRGQSLGQMMPIGQVRRRLKTEHLNLTERLVTFIWFGEMVEDSSNREQEDIKSFHMWLWDLIFSLNYIL